MQEIFKSGEYYIGSPELVLDYEGLEALGSFSRVCEIAGQNALVLSVILVAQVIALALFTALKTHF